MTLEPDRVEGLGVGRPCCYEDCYRGEAEGNRRRGVAETMRGSSKLARASALQTLNETTPLRLQKEGRSPARTLRTSPALRGGAPAPLSIIILS